MSSVISFKTTRLRVEDWQATLHAPEQRQRLADQLASVLTPKVLEPLPPALQLSSSEGAIAAWMEARAVESDVLTTRTQSEDLLGLVILASVPSTDSPRTVHFGYLFAEAAWGQGYATELIDGLACWFQRAGVPVHLLAGVGKDNSPSARVLIKNGFALDKALSSPETWMFSRTLSGPETSPETGQSS
ncbi:MAG: GNAT family N-acetyltransferase [Rhodospirillaceae bacterium]